ncbi:MAG: hypothetical protein AB7V26_11850 [Lysobacterales bacterium]
MKRSLIALALAAVLPWTAQAAELSYNYLEGDYVNIDGDADGFGVRGSLNFGGSDFYGFGSYNRVELDGYNFNIDTFDLGFGYHYNLSERAHLIAELAYVNSEFDIDAYRTSVGLRGLLTDRLEGIAKLNYSNGNNINSTTSGTAGLLFKFNKTWGLSGEVELAEQNVQVYTAGIRASF